MGGLVGIAYFVMAACTTICMLSAWFSWQTCKENKRLRELLRRLRHWYAHLWQWNVDQGLHPPTPEPEHVGQVEPE